MLYVYFLHTNEHPTLLADLQPHSDELTDHYAEVFGTEVRILGGHMIDGALPTEPDAHVVATCLMVMGQQGVDFDSSRDEIFYSVDQLDGKPFGVCRMQVKAGSASSAEEAASLSEPPDESPPQHGVTVMEADYFLERQMRLTAPCRGCGASIEFQQGGSLAMERGIDAKVVMCENCNSIYEVEMGPGRMQLTTDVTSRYKDNLQDTKARVGAVSQIEIEADTLQEAREQVVRSKIPEGLQVLSVRVISDGKSKTVRAVGDTVESAFTKAQGDMPANAVVVDKRDLSAPSQVITVEATGRKEARDKLRKKIGKPAAIGLPAPIIKKSFRLSRPGKRAFAGTVYAPLGIGWSHEQPGQYQAEVQQATVEVTYKQKAKISVAVGPESPQVEVHHICDALEEWMAISVPGDANELETILNDLDAPQKVTGTKSVLVERLAKCFLNDLREGEAATFDGISPNQRLGRYAVHPPDAGFGDAGRSLLLVQVGLGLHWVAKLDSDLFAVRAHALAPDESIERLGPMVAEQDHLSPLISQDPQGFPGDPEGGPYWT